MKNRFFVLLSTLLLCVAGVSAGEPAVNDSLPVWGSKHRSSRFFHEYYHTNDFIYYLDNLDDYTVYQSETTGAFNTPDRLIFSIEGNSYQWNRYYIDGFRTDSRFLTGSTFYIPDMYTHSFDMDYHRSGIYFNTDAVVPNSVRVTYNVGGLGGISAGTKQFINLFHKSAAERFYKPVEYRNHIVGAGSVALDYAVPVNGKSYMQSLSVDFGRRKIVDFDEYGISDFYPEDYFKINLAGQLPVEPSRLFDRVNYIFHASQRDNMNSESYYSRDETARLNSYSLSFYGVGRNEDTRYTSGLTLALNKVAHDNLNYMRNLIDQDGEGFEPWYPDGYNTELSYALNLEHRVNRYMAIVFDGYNSLLNFSPSQSHFSNAVYMRMPYEDFHSLYVYEWNSQAFWSGLFENTLGLKVERRWAPWIDFRAGVDLTFDAMVLRDKSMFRPNWQARVGFDIHPCSWFEMELNLSRNRVAFNYDDVRYLSNRYLNGDIYYWKDRNGDNIYQSDERSDYFTSTGGKYRKTAELLKQQTYFALDLPINFTFGNHRISFLNSFRKYFNTWLTRFDGEASDYGHYVQSENGQEIFFLNSGSPANYVVGYYPKEYMDSKGWGSLLTNTPYYMSSLIKYEYTGPKFFFMLSWQSFMMAGTSALGNGPIQNNIGALSESTANPNTQYKRIGRFDQDRAYIARMHVGYNINSHISVALTGKFKDGQPFSSFNTMLIADEMGNEQAAVWNDRTKGINPFDGDFGSREDAFFNFDLRASYRGNIRRMPFELEVLCYNIYDFGTELTEYTFNPNYAYKTALPNKEGRFAMSQSIPRGLLFSFRLGL